MLQFFMGKQEKQDKKVENDISDMLKNQLKKQFCQVCDKNPSSKVAFGKQFKPVFTCAGCELKAVGAVAQRLGPKNLIIQDKFVEVLMKEIINYQNNLKTPPVEQKKHSEACQTAKGKAVDMNTKIVEEYKKMKKLVKEKQDQIAEESAKQNYVFIFEEISKIIKENKPSQLQSGELLLKKSFSNNKGLSFYDRESIEVSNEAIEQRFNCIRKQSKIKLKPLQDLIDQIRNITLD